MDSSRRTPLFLFVIIAFAGGFATNAFADDEPAPDEAALTAPNANDDPQTISGDLSDPIPDLSGPNEGAAPEPARGDHPKPTAADERAVAEMVAPRLPEASPDGEIYMSDWRAAVLQYVTGSVASGVCCGGSGVIGAIIAVVLFVLPGGIIWSTLFLSIVGCMPVLAAPAAGGSAGVWLREWWGGRRGTWVWPVLGAYATELLAAGVMAAGTLVGGVMAAAFFTSIVDFNNPTGFINPAGDWAWFSLGGGGLVAGAGFFGGLLAAILGPALVATVTYDGFSDAKTSHDTGFRVPGLFSPNVAPLEEGVDDKPRKKRTRRRKSGRSPPIRDVAMQY